MYYYLFLFLASLTLLALCWALWENTGSIAFPFGLTIIYFWTLHGAWSIVTDLLGNDSHKHYHYLYDKVFPVHLDEYYAWALGLYWAFMVVVALTVLRYARPARWPRQNPRPLVLSHDRIIVACGLAALFSLWIMRESLGSAIQSGESGYAVTRSVTGDLGWFRIHQILNRLALIPPAIGFATLMAGGQGRYLTGEKCLRHYACYPLLLGFMFCFCVVLGNKNELVLALFSGCLFYVANSTRPKTWRLAASGIALLAGVGFIDYARGLSINQIASNVSLGEVAHSLSRLADSNEAFAAHISLYGVMYYDIPLTYGSSIYSFVMSVVPRAIWPDRPYDVYWYYANGISATEGQGYSIHHAAGWYLNFGIPGVFLGALLLGRVWAALYNVLIHHATRPGATWWRVFCSVGFFTFTASLPTLIRGGPEAYKSVLVESFFLPMAVLVWSQSPLRGRIQSNFNELRHRSDRVGSFAARAAARNRPKLPLSYTPTLKQ
jgi:hypothetical protein